MKYNDGIYLGSDKVWTEEAKALWNGAREVPWTEPGLKIVRLALLPPDFPLPYFEVSYCLGMVGKEHVNVINCPIMIDGRTWKTDFYKWGKSAGVFVKGLGIFDEDVIRWRL